MKKIKHIKDSRLSKSHRSGWNYVSDGLDKLSTPYGTEFFTWVDIVFSEGRILKKPWTGVVHSPITYPTSEYQFKYGKGIMCLEKLVRNREFQESLPFCKGVFSLSQTTTKFLVAFGLKCESLIHPCCSHNFYFDKHERNWGVAMIGQMMRKFHDFVDLDTRRDKKIIMVNGHEREYDAMFLYSKKKKQIQTLSRLENCDYDLTLKKNIVFLSLYDCSACNTVLECIMCANPLVVNRLPALEEYLGAEYPLFYEDINEASKFLDDDDLIIKGHEYLLNLDKSRFSIEFFIRKLTESQVYQNLSNPPRI